MNSVVIAGYARSPFQLARKGQFVRTRPDDIAAQVVRGLVERTGIASEDIEDLILGCAFPEGEQGFNLGRIVALLSDLPLSVGGVTVNRFCGSSMQSVHMAAGAVRMGAGEAFICAGVESMTRIPMGGFNPLPNPVLYKKRPGAYMDMGITAENVARKYEIGRDQQEQFALRSQIRARDAIAAGRLEAEIVPIQTRDGVVSVDGCPRPETTAEGLAGLKPAFDAVQGTVTAGTSSPLTDGAAAVLVCSEAYADRKGLPKLARIRSIAISGCEPEVMGLGPILSSRKALERAGITIEDVGVVELNEAFASQSIACARELGVRDQTLNIDGGAIALGHPLGATGARIVGKAAQLLEREGARYALATQCIGGGQGIATILERI